MADSFNAVDIIYSMISNNGVTCYKDKAPINIKNEHIVINSPASGPSSFGTIDSHININIFLPATGKAVPNRTRIKAIKDLIETAIDSASDPDGYYYYKDDGFEGYIDNVKNGLDCFSMRKILTLNK